MRHLTLVVGLALAGVSCKKDDPAPVAAPAADDGAAAAASGDSGSAPGQGAEGTEPAPSGTQADPPKKSGLASLTREVIEQARSVAGDPIHLVPNGATFIAQVRPPVVLAHPELGALREKGEAKDEDFRFGMDVIRTCMGKLEAIEQVVVGFDQDDHLVMIGRGKGLGTEATWRCFATESTARGKSMDLEVTGLARGAGPQLRETDGSPESADQGYFPDDDTAILVSREWDADVRALLAGDAKPAVERRLATPAGRITPEVAMWVAGRWDSSVAAALPDPIRNIEDLALSIGIEDEALVFDISVDAGSAAEASVVRGKLQDQFDENKSMLGIFGASSLASKITFGTEGQRVTLAFTMTRSELESMRRGVEGFL